MWFKKHEAKMTTEFQILIGNKNYSSWSMRGWLAMKLTGAPFDEQVVALFDSPDYKQTILEFSAAGKVPAIKHTVGGETLTVADSLALGEYLAERFPGAGLWPSGRSARARARAVTAEMHSGFPDLRRELPMNMHRDPASIEVGEAAQADISRVHQIWRSCLKRYRGPFLFGEPTLADCAYAPVVSRFATYAISGDESSSAYMSTITGWDLYREWQNDALQETWRIDRVEI